jgi:hypothetical protein
MQDFDRIWDKLADEGCCDARGGMEYRRVRAGWVAAGRPGRKGPDVDVIRRFIHAEANRGPT